MRGMMVLLLAGALFACGDDGGGDGDMAAGPCAADSDCDDAIFCNGLERCIEGSCTAGDAPCEGSCDEVSRECETGCVDRDGDGHEDIACGGDDCDDSDANRYPTNIEICDPIHDEDCDDTTFGDRDQDGDGAIDAACCNNGLCADDCDDSDPMVRPGASEICDEADDDCDGTVDEDPVTVDWCVDMDGDLFGDPDGEVRMSCAPIAGFSRTCTDCDDSRGAINPGARELTANGVDDDCDGAVDEGLSGPHGIRVLGGRLSAGDLVLSHTSIESYARTCSGDLCLTGGVLP